MSTPEWIGVVVVPILALLFHTEQRRISAAVRGTKELLETKLASDKIELKADIKAIAHKATRLEVITDNHEKRLNIIELDLPA